MSSPSNRLTLGKAIALGALHGPAELLPVSSSGHTALAGWLLGSEQELDKAFEVALHAGSAVALAVERREELLVALRQGDGRELALAGLALAPPVLAGYTLEGPIERRLGTPSTVAAAMLTGAVAMALADRAPAVRRRDDLDAVDALWLGIAQAIALIPGTSRNGATLIAARVRRFTHEDASRLSRDVALPVLMAATALESLRVYQQGLSAGQRSGFGLGVLAAFLSTLGCARLIRQGHRSLAPFAAYRAVVAVAVLARARRSRSGR